MYNFEEQAGEAKAVGWISMSDMFMLCSIVMLAVAVSFALSLEKSDLRLNSVQGEYTSYKNSNTLALAALNKEAGSYKSQAVGLDQQLNDFKLQLASSEKRGAAFRDESSKYKSQSEHLANEISLQITKMNLLRTEFDKYRTLNNSTQGDLRVELARLTTELDGYKANISTLNLQVSSLERKLSASEKDASTFRLDRDKLQTESGRLAADLASQKLALSSDLSKAGGELTRLSAELTASNAALSRANKDIAADKNELNKLTAERDQSLADLNSWKSNYSVLQKEDKDLKLKLSVLDDENKRAEVKLADLQGTIIGLTGELSELKPQVSKLKVDLSGANLRIIDLEKLVFEKVNRAKLIVTVTAQDVPKDFTLELMVTDPLANECGPFSAVVFNEGDEIGVLQQSIDFRSGKEGSQKAVFYSMRPIYSRMEPGNTYTVKAMIRNNSNDQNAQLPHPVTVNCTVELPNASGPEIRQVATLEITSPGYIKKARQAGQLSASTQYKNMWPWEPVYHFERTVCAFSINNDRITNFRTFEKLYLSSQNMSQIPISTFRGPEEQKIDSIRNRSGN